MEARHVPAGIRIFIGIGIFVLVIFLLHPSSPVGLTGYVFWSKTAGYFDNPDIEGFTGVSLLIICPCITLIIYRITINLIKRYLSASV